MSYDSRTITFLQTSDAAFRTWVAAVIAQLIATGLTQTADTGQINTATATVPAINTSAGYAIFRYNDTLQATSPVFLKFEFGSGSATTTPSIWLTMGKSTDGAGTLGTVFRSRTQKTLTANATGVTCTAAWDATIGCLWAQWSASYAANGFISLVAHRGCDTTTWAPDGNTIIVWWSTGTATAPLTWDLVFNGSASNGGGANMFMLPETPAIAGQICPLLNYKPVIYPVTYCFPVSGQVGNGQNWKAFPGVMGIHSGNFYPFQRLRSTYKGNTRNFVAHAHAGFMAGLGSSGSIRERFACVVPS